MCQKEAPRESLSDFCLWPGNYARGRVYGGEVPDYAASAAIAGTRGNAERAAFWTSFSNVMLVLTPAVSAMLVDPWAGACHPPLVGVVSRVKWGLTGLAMSVLMLGRVLGRFIPRTPVLPPTLPAAQKPGGEV